MRHRYTGFLLGIILTLSLTTACARSAPATAKSTTPLPVIVIAVEGPPDPKTSVTMLAPPRDVRFVPGSEGAGGGGNLWETFTRFASTTDAAEIAKHYADQAGRLGWDVLGTGQDGSAAAITRLHLKGASPLIGNAMLAIYRTSPDIVVCVALNLTDLSDVSFLPPHKSRNGERQKMFDSGPEFSLPVLYHPDEVRSLRASGGGDQNTLNLAAVYATTFPVATLVEQYATQLLAEGWSIEGRFHDGQAMAAVRLHLHTKGSEETSLMLSAQAIPGTKIALVTIHAAHHTITR
jgi:hypothetical protein